MKIGGRVPVWQCLNQCRTFCRNPSTGETASLAPNALSIAADQRRIGFQQQAKQLVFYLELHCVQFGHSENYLLDCGWRGTPPKHKL